MDDVLRESVEPVLRDLLSAGLGPVVVDEHDWAGDPGVASAMLVAPDGSETGFSAVRADPLSARVAHVTDQVQEWAIEDLLFSRGLPTSWPPCPSHPTTHPLAPVDTGDVAVWSCPLDGAVVAPVGGLDHAA